MTEFASTPLSPLSMQNERTYNFAQLVCPWRVRDYYLSICDAGVILSNNCDLLVWWITRG